jgi:GR25 family glycosyltransferase involved in LPS biosynthesis
MNLARPSVKIVSCAFQFWLALLRLLPKQKCQAFNTQGSQSPRIEKVYVINLDRASSRWSKIQLEIQRILDSSGKNLLNLIERHAAVDANAFLSDPSIDADIDPFYTLGDQLFVEPQPLVFPTKFELKTPIRMSRAEIAVARSHINVWRKVAANNQEYAMILEDDVWFHNGFAKYLDQVWDEVVGECDKRSKFDVLYLSYLEAKNGAPKSSLTRNVFRPLRGLWHLSGYILSREGAEKLLQLLPCRGPIDLWINHHFQLLDVLAAKKPIISQRRDVKSSNSYSILPALTKIGAINSEGASLFNIRPNEQPVFAIGPQGSGHSSLAMALGMLGYRCCSDLESLPDLELKTLLEGKEERVFNAYVNIGSLETNIKNLRCLYPNAKFILTAAKNGAEDDAFVRIKGELNDSDFVVLHAEEPNKWQVICEHLRCPPPTSSFPRLKDLGKRFIQQESIQNDWFSKCKKPKRDKSPWVVETRKWWQGIHSVAIEDVQVDPVRLVRINDCMETIDPKHWLLRNDTFTDNLALFRPSNVEIKPGVGAVLFVKSDPLGVRNYSAASICSRDQYLYGKFEANIQATNVPGVVTGFFLHRNSPRQEIDIEIAGNRPDRLMVNVFFNPGGEGANFDYGYRGAPTCIDLGFDASREIHRFTIEWSQNEIIWKVDGRIVHKRVVWDPTPIPHLPMLLHVNSWPTRSAELAGRINKRRLPGTAILGSIALEANSITSTLGPDADEILQTKNELFQIGELAQ